jgi:hypothetical protein
MKENVAKCDFFTDKYTFSPKNARHAGTKIITAAPGNYIKTKNAFSTSNMVFSLNLRIRFIQCTIVPTLSLLKRPAVSGRRFAFFNANKQRRDPMVKIVSILA